jgi:hypothetical protein
MMELTERRFKTPKNFYQWSHGRTTAISSRSEGRRCFHPAVAKAMIDMPENTHGYYLRNFSIRRGFAISKRNFGPLQPLGSLLIRIN